MARIVSYWTGSEAGMISGGARVEAAGLGGGKYYSEKLPDVGGAPDTPPVPCFELNQKSRERRIATSSDIFSAVLSIICSRCHTVG